MCFYFCVLPPKSPSDILLLIAPIFCTLTMITTARFYQLGLGLRSAVVSSLASTDLRVAKGQTACHHFAFTCPPNALSLSIHPTPLCAEWISNQAKLGCCPCRRCSSEVTEPHVGNALDSKCPRQSCGQLTQTHLSSRWGSTARGAIFKPDLVKTAARRDISPPRAVHSLDHLLTD